VRFRTSIPHLLACLAAWIALLALLIGLLAVSDPATAQGHTQAGGPITTPTNWTVAGSPYIVDTTLSIEAGGSLTIDPGVEVRFQAGTALRVVGGPLRWCMPRMRRRANCGTASSNMPPPGWPRM